MLAVSCSLNAIKIPFLFELIPSRVFFFVGQASSFASELFGDRAWLFQSLGAAKMRLFIN